MAYRITSCTGVVVLCVALAWPDPAAAQTLADALAAVDEAMASSDFARRDPVQYAELQQHVTVLRQSGLADWPVVDLAAALSEHPSIANLARLESGLESMRGALARVRALEPPLMLAGAIVDNDLTDALQATVGPAAATAVLEPWTALYRALLAQSLEDSLEKLRRYERKFGPGSARLNGVEVLANYALQRVRYFGPDPLGWPGPLEVIASYAPTYVTIAEGSARFVSAGEFGLRRYFFGESWGGSGVRRLLKPAFTTFGMAVAGERDGALRWPWQGQPRLGVFVSWGEVKLAYVGGRDRRLLVSRQFHLIPWLF